METTDSKQYGNSHSSVQTPGSTAETNKHGARDSPTQASSFSLAAAAASRAIGQPAEREDLPSRGRPAEEEAKEDAARTEQST